MCFIGKFSDKLLFNFHPQYISTNYQMYYLYYIMTCYMPMLLAAYNALVVATRSTGVRLMLREWWTRVRERGRARGADTATTGLIDSSATE